MVIYGKISSSVLISGSIPVYEIQFCSAFFVKDLCIGRDCDKNVLDDLGHQKIAFSESCTWGNSSPFSKVPIVVELGKSG